MDLYFTSFTSKAQIIYTRKYLTIYKYLKKNPAGL
jgi:hypothetical protein